MPFLFYSHRVTHVSVSSMRGGAIVQLDKAAYCFGILLSVRYFYYKFYFMSKNLRVVIFIVSIILGFFILMLIQIRALNTGENIPKWPVLVVLYLIYYLLFRKRDKWKGLDKMIGKGISILIEKNGPPFQTLVLSEDATIYIFEEMDKAASDKHKKLKRKELELGSNQGLSEDFNIYNYYIIKTNSADNIESFRKCKFEGRFTDANEIENWDDFINQKSTN